MTTKLLTSGDSILSSVYMTAEDTASATPQRGTKICHPYYSGYNELTNAVPYDILLTDGSDDGRLGLGLGITGPNGLHYIRHFHTATYWNGTTTYRRFSFFKSYVITYSAAGVPTVTNVVLNADVDAYGAYTARSYHSDYASDTTNFPVGRANIAVVSGNVYLRLYGSNSPAAASTVYHSALLLVNTVS